VSAFWIYWLIGENIYLSIYKILGQDKNKNSGNDNMSVILYTARAYAFVFP